MKNGRGNYNDIKDSDYTLEVRGMTFYFTSLHYKFRMIRLVDTNDDKIDLLHKYELCQKKGYRVAYKGVEYTCLETVLSALGKRM